MLTRETIERAQELLSKLRSGDLAHFYVAPDLSKIWADALQALLTEVTISPYQRGEKVYDRVRFKTAVFVGIDPSDEKYAVVRDSTGFFGVPRDCLRRVPKTEPKAEASPFEDASIEARLARLESYVQRLTTALKEKNCYLAATDFSKPEKSQTFVSDLLSDGGFFGDDDGGKNTEPL